MRLHKAHGVVLLLAPAVAMACTWEQLDAVGRVLGADDAEPPGASVEAGRQDASHPKDASDASSSETEGGEEAGVSTSPCTAAEQVLTEWTFDADASGWTLSIESGVAATMTWTSDAGNPTPGALQVEVTPRVGDGGATSGVWPQYNMTLGNLSGRTISAWVWLDSGPSPDLKLFVQTGTQWVWADNGTVHLAPKEWTCVSIGVSSPSYNAENYDPTDVVRLGFQLFGAAPFRMYVGTVRIY